MASQDEIDVLTKIKESVAQLLETEGVEIVELSFAGRGKGRVLRFLVDKPEGITLKECGQLNLKLSEILDTVDIIDESYTLEVSSPGLDRPLRHKRDFERVIGKLVRLTIATPLEGRTSMVCEVNKVETDSVSFKKLDGAIIDVPLNNIISARLEIEF
ncbi:MAG: ribosome maturation factor RimP [Candidatus Omnitrophica bacterium]|nr:ribosome maturation factor RimP [Candidatus Omnitrophota bacterium]